MSMRSTCNGDNGVCEVVEVGGVDVVTRVDDNDGVADCEVNEVDEVNNSNGVSENNRVGKADEVNEVNEVNGVNKDNVISEIKS